MKPDMMRALENLGPALRVLTMLLALPLAVMPSLAAAARRKYPPSLPSKPIL
jgi:hypothetical protein